MINKQSHVDILGNELPNKWCQRYPKRSENEHSVTIHWLQTFHKATDKKAIVRFLATASKMQGCLLLAVWNVLIEKVIPGVK